MLQEQDYRYDSRSQWQSSSVADLDRQQDPASAPPPRDEPAQGKSAVDPLGSTPEPASAPDAVARTLVDDGDIVPTAATGGGATPSITPTTSTNAVQAHGADTAAPAATDPQPLQTHDAASSAEQPDVGAPAADASAMRSSEAASTVNAGTNTQVSVSMPGVDGGAHQVSLGLHANLALSASIDGLLQNTSGLLGEVSQTVSHIGGGAATLLGQTVADAQALLVQTVAGTGALVEGVGHNAQALLDNLSDDLGLGETGLADIDLSQLQFAALDGGGLLGDDDADDDWSDGVDEAHLADLAQALDGVAQTIFGADAGHELDAHDIPLGLDAGVAELAGGQGTAPGSLLGGLDGHSVHDPFDLSG